MPKGYRFRQRALSAMVGKRGASAYVEAAVQRQIERDNPLQFRHSGYDRSVTHGMADP
jgi:hypothetical protein